MATYMVDRVAYDDVVNRFGPHGNFDGQVSVELPFRMYLSWEKETTIGRVYVHPYIADDLEEALRDIKDYYSEEFITEHNLNEWGGSFNDRFSRGSNRWSVHSWGLAVDYLPSLGRFGVPAQTPYVVVEAFKDHGFAWGGDWMNPDGMHFSGVDE